MYFCALKKIIKVMALEISNIPVLEGQLAESFIEKAEKAEKERGTVDMSEQRRMMHVILNRSK